MSKAPFYNSNVEGLRQEALKDDAPSKWEAYHEARSWTDRLERHDAPEYMPTDETKERFVIGAVLSVGMFILGGVAGLMLGKTPEKGI